MWSLPQNKLLYHGPYHGVQSLRNRLLQCVSPTYASPARKSAPVISPWGCVSHWENSAAWALHELQLPLGQIYLPPSWAFPQGTAWRSALVLAVHGLWGGCLQSQMILSMCCRGISDPAPEGPHPSSLTLVSVELFPSKSFPHSSLRAAAVICMLS